MRSTLVLAWCFSFTIVGMMAASQTLPERTGPVPRTTDSVPHVQLDMEAVPAIARALIVQVAHLPGAQLGPSRLSLPGTVGFQFTGGQPMARPEALIGRREFAHLVQHSHAYILGWDETPSTQIGD